MGNGRDWQRHGTVLEYRIRVEGVWEDFGEIWAFQCEVARADRREGDVEVDTRLDEGDSHTYRDSDTVQNE